MDKKGGRNVVNVTVQGKQCEQVRNKIEQMVASMEYKGLRKIVEVFVVISHCRGKLSHRNKFCCLPNSGLGNVIAVSLDVISVRFGSP